MPTRMDVPLPFSSENVPYQIQNHLSISQLHSSFSQAGSTLPKLAKGPSRHTRHRVPSGLTGDVFCKDPMGTPYMPHLQLMFTQA